MTGCWSVRGRSVPWQVSGFSSQHWPSEPGCRSRYWTTPCSPFPPSPVSIWSQCASFNGSLGEVAHGGRHAMQLGLLIGVDDLQLGQRNRQRVSLPGHEHEHLVLALLLGCHPHDLDLITNPQWRGRTPGDAGGQEGELQMILQVVTPTDRLLFRTVGINDDLRVNALFAFLIRGNALHRVAPVVPSDCHVKIRETPPSLRY